MEANGGRGALDPDEEELEEGKDELDDFDPEQLPRIFNAQRLDQADLQVGQLLALRFSGEGIGRRGASLRLASELFADLYRFFVGAQPVAAGREVELSGSPPRLPGIEAPLLQGAVAGRSITVVLGLAGQEVRNLSRLSVSAREELVKMKPPFPGAVEGSRAQAADGEASGEFPTVAVAHWLTEMLSSKPTVAVEKVQTLGRRATRDYLSFTDLIASNELDTSVRAHDRKRAVVIPSGRAWATAECIRETQETATSRFTVSGALYQADAKNDRFRLVSNEGVVYRGTYLAGMTPLIRDAWAKLVRATLLEITYRWVGAEKPHKTVYELESIDRVLGDAGELLGEDSG